MARIQVHISALFDMFSMKPSETKIFDMLLKRPMTVTQIEKISGMSERMIRSHLGDLFRRKLINKKPIDDGRLKYIYYPIPPESVLKAAKGIISSIEKSRARAKMNIISGSEAEVG